MTSKAQGLRFSFSVALTLMTCVVAGRAMAQSTSDFLSWDETLGLCASCHGANGMGNLELESPRLAGQGRNYLEEQLTAFAQGRRGTHPDDLNGQIMAASSMILDDATITGLADHYASLEGPKPMSPPLQTGKTGDASDTDLYAAHCASCHGASGEGADVLYVPNLTLLDASYLRRQIKAYQKGWRGGPNASTRSKGMRQLAYQLTSQEEIDEVIQYLTGTEGEPVTSDTELKKEKEPTPLKSFSVWNECPSRTKKLGPTLKYDL